MEWCSYLTETFEWWSLYYDDGGGRRRECNHDDINDYRNHNDIGDGYCNCDADDEAGLD